MLINFYDVETTGLPNFKAPKNDASQPHICQVAAILADSTGKIYNEINLIVCPNGWEIPEENSRIHGITNDIATATGVTMKIALALLSRFVSLADLSVGHNVQFDNWMVSRDLLGAGFEESMIAFGKTFCTMKETTEIVNLPPTAKMVAAGFNKPKSPKLEEAYKHFFGEELQGAHDAMVDVRACMRIYYHLQTLKP